MKFIFSKKPNQEVTKVIFTKKEENQVLIAADINQVEIKPGQKIISLGLGEIEKFNLRKFILLGRKIIVLAKANKIKKIIIDFQDLKELLVSQLKLESEELAQILATEMIMANFEFVKYKEKPKEGFNLVEIVEIININPKEVEAFKKGMIIGEEVNNCRFLVNTPAGDMTPKVLAEQAVNLGKKYQIPVKILNQKQITDLKMGGILGVAKGSTEEPKFIILEYKKGGQAKPTVLVGKGVTFDSGGLSLKPADSMIEMGMDMSGGAAVIHTMALAARLGLKKNIIGLIPAVENMPSGSSYRPGDILKMMSGKTVEILNTDAEGRVILADALTYAKKYQPVLVIDIATLTGSAVAALGERAVALFTRDESLEKSCREKGELSGDYVWPLPLWDEYETDIKGTFGDIINTGKNRYGGAILGAMFLYQFAKDYPWIHLDIAPRMTSIEGDYLAKGAVGSPIRLLIKLLEKR